MAITTSKIDPQYKQMLSQVLEQKHIAPDSAEGRKILAMGMIEGDLGPSAQDKSKSGGSANLTGFNINQGMVDDLRQNNMLPAGFKEEDLKSSDYKAQMSAAVEIMDAFFKKDNTGDQLAHWVRGGSATAEQGFESYNSALKNTEAQIEKNPEVWKNSDRYSDDVPYQ